MEGARCLSKLVLCKISKLGGNLSACRRMGEQQKLELRYVQGMLKAGAFTYLSAPE